MLVNQHLSKASSAFTIKDQPVLSLNDTIRLTRFHELQSISFAEFDAAVSNYTLTLAGACRSCYEENILVHLLVCLLFMVGILVAFKSASVLKCVFRKASYFSYPVATEL